MKFVISGTDEILVSHSGLALAGAILQRMVRIENLVEVGPKQIGLIAVGVRTWSHGAPKVQDSAGNAINTLQILQAPAIHSSPVPPRKSMSFRDDYGTSEAGAVPEPGSLALLLGIAVTGLFYRRRRRV